MIIQKPAFTFLNPAIILSEATPCIRGTGLTTDYTVGKTPIKGWENKYNIITSK